MSRQRISRQAAIEAARKAFQREIKIKRIDYEMSQSALANLIGVGSSRMSVLMANPEQLTIERLQKIISILDIDPEIVLALLGYTQKQIEALKRKGN